MSNPKRKKSQKQKEYRTLLSVLANASTDKARQLLMNHTGQDASDTNDLQVKLARLYAVSTSKHDIEKEFAEIHPHKDFILKYAKKKEEPTKPLEAETENKIEEGKVVKQVIAHDGYLNAEGHPPCGNPNCPKCGRYLNCEGNQNCSCNQKSNACGCGNSSFSGE